MTDPIGSNSASDVYVSENNLSTIIQTVATASGAAVGWARRGPLGPQLNGDYANFKRMFGPSTPSKSLVHMAVRDYFAKGGAGLFFNRVAGAGYAYAGVLLQNFGPLGSTRTLRLTSWGQAGNPEAIDFTTAGGVAGDPSQNLAYIYAIGPGADYNRYSISISSDNVRTPVNVTATAADTGGKLLAGTYQYSVTALSNLGETGQSTQVNATIATGTTGQVTISWDSMPGATGYRIYGRQQAGAGVVVGLLGVTTAGVVTFVDNGTAIPGSQAPVNKTYADTPLFSVNVFDLDQSTTTPVESWPVQLAPGTNGFNNQLEIEAVLEQSTLVRCVSNYANLTAAPPTIYQLAQQQFAGGLDGAAVTESDLINAWNAFDDKDSISIAQMVNGGYSLVSVQKHMITIAKKRKDCVAFLDIPSGEQEAVRAQAYRRLTLNENTDRGILLTCDMLENDPDNNAQVWVPLSGAAAGSAAAVDLQFGPGGSIAGPSFGAISTAIRLRHKYDQTARNLLASSQVNYVRSRTGIGVYLAEQLTLSTPASALSYYSVRRIFDVMENSIELALLYSLQQPNDEQSARQIANMLTVYLTGLQAARKINGFSVQVNNSPAVRDQGKLYVYAAIEPKLPINQIGLMTILTPQGADFQEILGSVNPAGLTNNA